MWKDETMSSMDDRDTPGPDDEKLPAPTETEPDDDLDADDEELAGGLPEALEVDGAAIDENGPMI